MDLHVLLLVALRASVVYAFLIVVVRMLGKRKVGDAGSAFDLIVAVLLAALAAQAVFGSVTLLSGLFAVAVVGAWHLANYHLSAKHPRWQRMLTPMPTVLVRDGEILRDALKAEQMTDAELRWLLREHGINDPGEVRVATLEPSGVISVVHKDQAFTLRPALKRGGV